MLILACASSLYPLPTPSYQFSHHCAYFPPIVAVPKHCLYARTGASLFCGKQNRALSVNMQSMDREIEEAQENFDGYEDDYGSENSFSSDNGFGGREEEKDYDRDPELAEILGSCLDNPEKARKRMEERLRRKRNKVLHTKTGSNIPVKVTLNKFNFSNSYIWFEFYNAPLERDVTLICDAIRSWHIIGRLGGCNSMNMQLSQSTFDRRPNYDAIQGANVTPTTFYNIGDFEIQDNLARIWVDIGITEPLILDILINALTQISSDYVGIKQLVFGGSEFENWKENWTSEDAGCSVQKI
ncbi:hypothetical protein JCGZ_07325 [Jatropha curcas]|uniref:Uncharacterized protein n=1 Tax=Jatropha curcas TaxID=180498 RepID=A0A067KPN8_JATCU|nr:uncharacterized protein LOC105637796 [Jatropha curcas]KDP33754.1 hypothetical protein JCGZ_07325 [Jatropha curcas]